MLTKGDFVRLSESGKLRFAHSYRNPHDQVGKVTNICADYAPGTYSLDVRWDSYENDYHPEDLEPTIDVPARMKKS